MTNKNQFTLQVDHLLKGSQTQPVTATAENREINVQVANGWSITGTYQNNILQTITLQKISQIVSSQ